MATLSYKYEKRNFSHNNFCSLKNRNCIDTTLRKKLIRVFNKKIYSANLFCTAVLPTVRGPSLVKLNVIKINSNEIYFKYI